MSFLSLLGLALLFAVVLILFVASRRPDEGTFSRSMRIRATPERLYPLINDLRAMNRWNPYANRDPAMAGSYSGPDAGPGATFTFAGKKSGTGSIAITEAHAPREVVLRLLMSAPFACDNRVEFTLDPKGEETDVTWAMSGKASFVSKVMCTVLNMDKMMAKDFDQGLAALKAIAEDPKHA
jgi:uncharacterized protein YndB with AHSA1/START domain